MKHANKVIYNFPRIDLQHTDVAKTFMKVRRRQAEEAKLLAESVANVTVLAPRKVK